MCHSLGSASRSAGPWRRRHVCLSFSLSPQYASMFGLYLNLTWHPGAGTTSSPLSGLNQSSQCPCPRSVRVLMTSCACHLTPIRGAKFIHPVLTASLRTNKMAHTCREDCVDTFVGVQLPDGQAVTMGPRPRG